MDQDQRALYLQVTLMRKLQTNTKDYSYKCTVFADTLRVRPFVQETLTSGLFEVY